MLDLTTAFATFPILETERLILRAPTIDDVADLFAVDSDPRVTRYLGFPPLTNMDEAVQRVQRFTNEFQGQQAIRWVVSRRAEPRLLGIFGFVRMTKPHFRAELGYMLGTDSWGQGIASEACRPILDFGFTQMGLHSVEARIDPDNIGSQRVLEKLGFVREAYFRQNFYEPAQNRFTDTAVFGLLKSELIL